MTILESRRWILSTWVFKGKTVGSLGTNQLQYALQFCALDNDEKTAIHTVMRHRDVDAMKIEISPDAGVLHVGEV